MRLNYKKRRAAFDAAIYAEQKTVLLSIRAHITGKIHRNRARIDWRTLHKWEKITIDEAMLLSIQGGTQIVDLTAEDQAKWVAEAAVAYVLTEEEQKALMVVKPKSLLQVFREKLRQVF